MLLNELLKAIQPVQVTGDSRIEITGVNIDSRLVEAGQLFMAMRGTQTDGHAYIPAAIQKGATAIKPPEAGKPGFWIETIILYFGSSDGKYPQKLTR